ncbi:MAG: amidohydrolase family protein [Hyphomicrobiaceae bacterium]
MTIPVEQNTNRHIPVRPDWLARHTEPALEPDLPVIDPHHHLWAPPVRPQHYFLEEFNQDLSQGHNIVSTVFIECHAMYRATGPEEMKPVGEVEFANGQAAQSASGHYGRTRIADGIVGYAPLGLGGDVEPVLAAMVKAGGRRFKGVRNISAYHPDPEARGSSMNPPPDVLTNPRFLEGLKVLTRMGLTFDCFMYHPQLPEIVDVARACPDAVIVLNHCGGTIGIGPYASKRAETMAEWKALMTDVAACPNIRVKVGGLGMRLYGFDIHAGEMPPDSARVAEAWRPHVETCIELFGPERCMLESNFPVDKGSLSYGVLWNAFKRLTAKVSADEKAWLYRRCAAETYTLDI